MGFNWSDSTTGTKYGTGDLSSGFLDLADGDLIVVAVGVQANGTYCYSLSDSVGNDYTVRSRVLNGTSGTTLVIGYCLNAKARINNQVTATFNADTAQRKTIMVASYTPDSGETVVFDFAESGTGSDTNPITSTNTVGTTGDDSVCYCGMARGTSVGTRTNEQIPSGTAATPFIAPNEIASAFEQILTAPLANINGELDLSFSSDWAIELVAFKSVKPLDDTNLIVRYYCDEAASGRVPIELKDKSGVGTAFNLPINYDVDQAVFTEVSGNRGLEFDNAGSLNGARAEKLVNSTSDKVRDNIAGSKVCTIELVMDLTDSDADPSRIFGLHTYSGNGQFHLLANELGNGIVRFNGNATNDTFAIGYNARNVWHIVLDTSLGTADDRIKVYKNGQLITSTVTTAITQDATIVLPSDTYVIMGNRSDGTRAIGAVMFYSALYAEAFTAQRASDHYDVLTLDDDRPAGPIILTGSPVENLVIPAMVGIGPFAADGAQHIDPAAGIAKVTMDMTRLDYKTVLHDWGFKTGLVASPTDHLLCHLKCNENAASANLNDETANNADGTWGNTSDGSDRNTNTSGDSVVEIGRGRNLDTQNQTGYIKMAAGSGTVHDADFFSKGSILLKWKPKFLYTDSVYMEIINCYVNSTNYIRLLWYHDTNVFYFDVRWGGSSSGIFLGPDYSISNNEMLQRETIILAGWDSGKNFTFIDYQGHSRWSKANTGIPSGHPITFHIGCDGSRSQRTKMVIDDIKTFDECILPYGAIFTGNGGVNVNHAHRDITAYIKGDENHNDSLQIGTGVITVVNATHAEDVQGNANGAFLFDASGEYISIENENLDLSEFTIQFWFKQTIDKSSGAFISCQAGWSEFSLYRAVLQDALTFYYNDNVIFSASSISDIWDGNWNHIRLSCYHDGTNLNAEVWINRVLEITDSAIESVQTTYGTAIYIGADGTIDPCGGRLCDIYFTDKRKTPQIWTAFGKPRHMPIEDKT